MAWITIVDFALVHRLLGLARVARCRVVGGIGILEDGVIISGISSYSGRINGVSVFNNGPELGLGTTEYCAFRVTIFFASSGWV